MGYKSTQMKPLSDLNLMDRFLFACASEQQEIMELILQIILERDVSLYDVPQAEKELRTVPWLRSIRLDVIAMDEQGVYNAEVQKKNTGNLRKRGRYYQSLMDSVMLPPGEVDFNKMPDVTLITICPFDLFGEGRYRYTFRMQCVESEGLWLDDGGVRVVLNTCGRNVSEEPEELVELLQYFENSTEAVAEECKSERIRQLHRMVGQIKSSEEIGVRYMQAWEEKIYERMEAKEEGIEEGRAGLLLSQIEKKLVKGKTVSQIADELEEEISVIEDMIRKLEEVKGVK